MTTVKSFSISWKRQMFCLKLFGLSPSGKERVNTLYLPAHQVEQLVSALQRAVEQKKKKLSPENAGRERTKYIG